MAIDGGEIHELDVALDADGSPSVPSDKPTHTPLPIIYSTLVNNVKFIDSTANIEMVGSRQVLSLSDVELVDSNLTVENRLSETRAGDKPFLMVLEDSFSLVGASRFSHIVQGTDAGDTVLIGGFDVLVGPDAQFETLVETRNGPDRFFGVFEVAGSSGFVSIRVLTGADDDRAVLAVFGVEGLQRLFALLDAGPGADRVLASPEVTVLNSGDLVARAATNDNGDGRGELDAYLDRVHNLFLSPDSLTYERLEAETRAASSSLNFLDEYVESGFES